MTTISNVRIDCLEQIRIINEIAISEVPVNEKSPVYLLFHHRKLIAQKIVNVDNDNTLELLTDMIEYCNSEIKKCLGIW